MSTSPAAAHRDETIASLTDSGRASVLVIGGGINGIATFRDLALQGVDVVLVERGDFASGATSASSHMIHGGVRYLENGEFRLVQESVHERNELLRAAPHFVKPLKTTIPIYSLFSGAAERAGPLPVRSHGPTVGARGPPHQGRADHLRPLRERGASHAVAFVPRSRALSGSSPS